MKKFVLTLTFILISVFVFNAYCYTEHGKATYYTKAWAGRKTASGERLSNTAFTCAHKKLPFGTMLKVTNKKTGKSVIVKVNDRGPYSKGRIIDLSWGAAKEIGMLKSGVIDVVIEVIDPKDVSEITSELNDSIQAVDSVNLVEETGDSNVGVVVVEDSNS